MNLGLGFCGVSHCIDIIDYNVFSFGQRLLQDVSLYVRVFRRGPSVYVFDCNDACNACELPRAVQVALDAAGLLRCQVLSAKIFAIAHQV